MTAAATMLTKNIVPLFNTDKLEETKAFYTGHLGFEVFWDSDVYVGLRCPANPAAELGFMNPPDGSEPLAVGQGLYYTLEVEDVDAEHARLVGEGVEITNPPENMPWGARRMIVTDPNGILVFLYVPAEMAEEFKQYVKE